MSPVDDPAQADAVIDLEYGTVRPISVVPVPRDDGFVNCWSNSTAVSCTGGGYTSITRCSGTGENIRCSGCTYDDAALFDGVLLARAEVDHAIMRKITSKTYLLDKDGKHLLWQYDEGVRREKNGIAPEWWAQLNAFAGCGKPRNRYKKHMQ